MRLLDLFCGAGGAAVGYRRAGFTDIVGVDIRPMPRYPFQFIQCDALEFCRSFWAGFDAIHASPPCQAFTQISARWRGKGTKADAHPDLLKPTQELLATLGVPYIIESVLGATRKMPRKVTLHGGMFGLGVRRPRLFQSNVVLLTMTAPATKNPIGVYGDVNGRYLRYRNNGNYKGKSMIRAWKSVAEGQQAMGIDWTDDAREIAEAIPPAYTEYLGRQLLAQLQA